MRVQAGNASHRRSSLLSIGLLIAAAIQPSAAQDHSAWPQRALTLIVPTAPGSGADALARIVAPALNRALGQTVVVDNRVGANSQIGAQAAARAAPDGYTLFMGSATTHAVNPSLYGARLTYAPADLDIVATVGAGPALWLVSTQVGASNAKEYVAWAQRNPDKASCAYGNSVGQVGCELFRQRLGAAGQQVPYRSTPQALNDLAAGIVTSAFADAAVAMPLLQSGKIKAIAVAHTERLAVLPDTPTTRELGHAELQFLAWTGLFVPRGTPAGIQQRLNAAVVAANATPEAQAQLARSGGVQMPGDIAQARQFVQAEALRWQAFIRESGVKPE
jgi:tripartite-type tricarboxylate transporter receptor subunit TctC